MLPERYDPTKCKFYDQFVPDDTMPRYTILDTISFEPEIMGNIPLFAGTNIPIQAIFELIYESKSIEKAIEVFRKIYPEVPYEKLLNALYITTIPDINYRLEGHITKQRIDIFHLITVDPRMLGGDPVFYYFRVHVSSLFNYIIACQDIKEGILKFYSSASVVPSVGFIFKILKIVELNSHPNLTKHTLKESEVIDYIQKAFIDRGETFDDMIIEHL